MQIKVRVTKLLWGDSDDPNNKAGGELYEESAEETLIDLPGYLRNFEIDVPKQIYRVDLEAPRWAEEAS